jgi:nucleotide-binding universal stress UspA family protein
MAIRGASDRETLTVARHEGRWAVEHQGEFSDHTPEKEEAKAAANKRARALQDQGRPCQVRVSGEHGSFADA